MGSLKKDLVSFFMASFQNAVEMMTSQSLRVKEMVKSENIYQHYQPGISSIVGFVGKGLKGRSLLWAPSAVSLSITQFYVGETYDSYKEELVLYTMGEINNVLSGHATTKLNDRYHLSIRLTPPSIFAGKSLSLITPKLDSYSFLGSFNGEDIYLDIALEGARLRG